MTQNVTPIYHAKRKDTTPLLLAAALLLSACGIKGDLETPPPIWGEKSETAQPVKPDSDS